MSGAKTEEPTPKRLRRAREEGDTAASVFAAQTVGLVAAISVLPATAAVIAGRVQGELRDAFRTIASPGARADLDVSKLAVDVALLSAPILAAIAVATAAVLLLQTGGLVATRRLAPRLDRLNPFTGLGRLVSRASLFGVARALSWGAIIAWLAARALRDHAIDAVRTSGRLELAGRSAAAIARTISWNAALVGLAIAAADVLVMRADWRRRHRMSRSDVQRELKESGDPQATEARRRARAEVAARGAVGAVRRARIVICDGARAAYALRYDAGDEAPSVLASGEGAAADAILREARRLNVAVTDDAAVARALANVEAGALIPQDCYDPIAELLRDRD